MCSRLRITDEGLKLLPRTIQTLNLTYCPITDEGLKHIPFGIQSLEVAFCQNLTNAGIESLPKSIKSIDVTEVCDTPGLTCCQCPNVNSSVIVKPTVKLIGAKKPFTQERLLFGFTRTVFNF